MGLNITQKIIKEHLLEGNMQENEQITIKVDQTLCHDLTGIMAGQVLESIDIDKVRTEESFFYCDHNVIETSPESSDNVIYLKTIAQRYGIYFSEPGNGICHFLHYQRFAKPGKVLLGADSHTPTSGALGMLAIGSGGLSIAKSMIGEGFKLVTPKVINIKLKGKLKCGVSAKDIALEALRILSVKGAVGYIIEFTGDGVKSLSIPQRSTIANMTVEMGAVSCIFPSDEITYEFLKAQNREKDWIELLSDKDAVYDKTIEINISELRALVAKPHMPDLVVPVNEVSGVKVNSVFIGSCTNASYSDIVKASKILKGKKIHKDVELTIAPGSRQVLTQLIKDGILEDLVESGARILECACGPCIGIGQIPHKKGVTVRTSNRNFLGRSGRDDAYIYLTSTEVAAATAIVGKITDPRDIFDVNILNDCIEPKKYNIDDSRIISPKEVKNARDVKIIRGDRIKKLPIRDKLKELIKATAIIKLGDNITTDDIIPGGENILKHIADIPKFAQYTFYYKCPSFPKRAMELKSSVIIAGENYGQGSSREHAALLPMFLGVEAVIAKSYGRIHKENLINYGILPLEFENNEDYERIDSDDVFVINDVYSQLDKREMVVDVVNRSFKFNVKLEVSDFDRRVLKEGGALNYLRNKYR